MFLRAFRRSSQRRYVRATILVAVLAFLLDLSFLLNQYKHFQVNLYSHQIHDVQDLPHLLRDQKIYIAATHWNSEAVLRSHWSAALLDLVRTLGTSNVYVSVAESGSWDETKEELRKLDHELDLLSVARTIVLDPTSHEDEMSRGPAEGVAADGWIKTPRSGNKKELRRIPYLARLRNLSLRPLSSASNATYDKVLFLNDVVFKPEDVLTLLATHDGMYDAACALDFKSPPLYYDTFALRDSLGGPTAGLRFPYFRSADSRKSLLRGAPTKVRSCWNGMVIMDADPFRSSADSSDGLAFRGIQDSLAEKHLEGSECCLIHADMATQKSGAQGVWLNPCVRVGYSGEAYDGVHPGNGAEFITARDYLGGIWNNRIERWTTSDRVNSWRVSKRVQEWRSEGDRIGEDRFEPGEMCLINEMHVLIENGWKHL